MAPFVAVEAGQLDDLVEERLQLGLRDEEAKAADLVRGLLADFHTFADAHQTIEFDDPGVVVRQGSHVVCDLLDAVG